MLALFVALANLGCRQTDDGGGNGKGTTPKPKPKTYTWGGPKNISMAPIVADQQGFFTQEGINVKPNYIQTGKMAMDAVVSKDIDFGVLVETNIAFIKYQPGADVQIVCAIEEKHDDAIVARRDRGIKGPKDLKGKTLAILSATTSHVFADRFLKANGVAPGEVKTVNLTPPAMQAAVINGDVDAASVWQPFRYNVLKALGNKAVELNDPGVYTAYAVVAVRKEFAEKNPEAVKSFVRALIKAESYIKGSPDQAIPALAKEIDIDAGVLRKIWGEYSVRINLDAKLLATIREEGSWIHETQKGFGDKTVPAYSDAINSTFLAEVDASRVTLPK